MPSYRPPTVYVAPLNKKILVHKQLQDLRFPHYTNQPGNEGAEMNTKPASILLNCPSHYAQTAKNTRFATRRKINIQRPWESQ